MPAIWDGARLALSLRGARGTGLARCAGSTWASVPGAGPTTAWLQEEGQAGLSKSMCLSRGSGPCGGRESLGAAECVLPPPGVFSTCSHTLPAAVVLPLRYEQHAGPGCLPSAPCPVTSPGGQAGARLQYQTCPQGVTRGSLRTREPATRPSFLQAATSGARRGKTSPPAPSQSLQVIRVQRDWGFFKCILKINFCWIYLLYSVVFLLYSKVSQLAHLAECVYTHSLCFGFLPRWVTTVPSVALHALPRRLPSVTGVMRRVDGACTSVPISQSLPTPSPLVSMFVLNQASTFIVCSMPRPNLEGVF